MGDNPLVCVGVNPSTATPDKLDPTVTRVKNRAASMGCNSWIMLNLYPQRSTDPGEMHDHYLPELKAQNELQIAEVLRGPRIALLGAWGGLIEARGYLPQLLNAVPVAAG